LEFHSANVASDAGLLLNRELEEAFGLTAIGSENVDTKGTSAVETSNRRKDLSLILPSKGKISNNC